MLSLRDRISNADDSFTKLLEEIRQISTDEAEFEKLLTERILTGFIVRCVESKKVAKDNGEKLGFLKTKKDGGFKLFGAADCIHKKKRLNRKRAGKVPEFLIQSGRSLTETEVVASDVSSCVTSGLEKEEEEVENRRKKKRNIIHRPEQDLELEAEPVMAEKFKRIINEMNGMKIMFVMQKRLTETDVAKVNNRLSIPRKQMRNCNFVDEEEMKTLDEKKGIKVNVVTPSMETVELELKKWEMGSTYTYNLIGAWIKKVVDKEANQLQPGRLVQLWSFRQDSKLCFLLDNVGC
ncbi:putative B3 domain-containing protein At3g24850 [Mangifera indica]|uniref:putative B3 domain-containing protein At3g24850 n=1 Tax=Mangifera indica TaxID=29780 RepID=UPI001CFB258A|nr:putative B3 domain-containing protein At3g24850 [Mangifera indica]